MVVFADEFAHVGDAWYAKAVRRKQRVHEGYRVHMDESSALMPEDCFETRDGLIVKLPFPVPLVKRKDLDAPSVLRDGLKVRIAFLWQNAGYLVFPAVDRGQQIEKAAFRTENFVTRLVADDHDVRLPRACLN